ncbi:hypothetical protein ATJ88_2884 [Isoptericola jiangsuensis]|uniref:Uncharacterized protein n=1 Tax=Isoptericola jiangsuensis TaxID=548579 RepID=A0A2A9F046_9MICO|nr:hypothetical protein [Isoptericola jiangsuensis]PFG44166.1 hypothetical protein ATJ88_2884 [Isoptericola jiangsuensis]
MRIDVLAVLLVVVTAVLLGAGHRSLAAGTTRSVATGALLLAVGVIAGFAAVLTVAALPVW